MSKNKKTFRDVMNMGHHEEVAERAEFHTVSANFEDYSSEDIHNHNAGIEELNPLYTKLTPTNKVLVRCYLKQLTEKNGVLIPDYDIIYGKTANGMGQGTRIEDPYPYQHKAVIIATPPMSFELPYEVGDTVILGVKAISKVLMYKGDDGMPVIDNSFVHPSHDNPHNTELDLKSEHYGYITVGLNDIEFVM